MTLAASGTKSSNQVINYFIGLRDGLSPYTIALPSLKLIEQPHHNFSKRNLFAWILYQNDESFVALAATRNGVCIK